MCDGYVGFIGFVGFVNGALGFVDSSSSFVNARAASFVNARAARLSCRAAGGHPRRARR